MKARHLIRFVITLAVFVPFLLYIRGNANPLGFLDDLEAFAYDARLLLTLPQSLDDRIVIVDIDEKSLAAEGQWPWGRDRVARLVDQLFGKYSAKVVGFDVIFPEPDRSSGLSVLEQLANQDFADQPGFLSRFAALRASLDWDQVFANSLRDRNTVLGFAFRPEDQFDSFNVLPTPLLRGEAIDNEIKFIEADRFTGTLSLLVEAAADGGFIDNPSVDSDGSFRRVPLMQKYRENLYPSLALAVARLAVGSPPLEFVFHGGRNGRRDGLNLEWLRMGDYRIPVDATATVLVPYRGHQYSFPYVSATDVLNGTAPQYPLKGSIVLVGTSAAGLMDMRVTPVGSPYNGVEVQANIVSGILDQRIMQHPRYVFGMEIVILVLLAVLVTWMTIRLPVITNTLATLLLVVVIIAANLQFWERGNLLVPLAWPVMFVFALFLLHLIFGFFTETRGRRLLSAQFGQYVPPELVAEMGQRPADFNMESESREMTVMFSDVRGFTGIAENLEPRVLSQLMNEFLTPMTKTIHRHRGTIDKYMGDAIMAFWGAPLADPDHARNALQAAMEMQGAMVELADSFRAKDWPEIKIGIGISTGVMRVGDMGSQFRKAYTVLGDAVNLGARLEGLTKFYGVPIAVTEHTVEAVPDFAFLELDRVRVKGKDLPVAIFEPLGSRADLDGATGKMLGRHKSALRAYRVGDWDSAESAFFTLQQSYSERPIFGIYLDRIAHFRSHPPPDDWDGVFTQMQK